MATNEILYPIGVDFINSGSAPLKEWGTVPQFRKVAHSRCVGKLATRLSYPVIMGLELYAQIHNNAGKGGVGRKDGDIIAEYKCGSSHIVGSLSGDVLNVAQVLTVSKKIVKAAKQDEACVMACLLLVEAGLADGEFKDNAEKFWETKTALEKADFAAICASWIEAEMDNRVIIDAQNNFNARMIESGDYAPVDIAVGEFTVLCGADNSAKKMKATKKDYTMSDLVAENLRLSERNLSEEERKKVPVLRGNMMVPDSVVKMVKMMAISGKYKRLRNALLYGPAGTGKSTTAEMVASALDLPFVSMCFASDASSMETLGGPRPRFANEDAETTLPKITPEDMTYDPEGSWEILTGEKAPEGITSSDVQVEYLKREAEQKGGFVFQESALVEAFRKGYVVELQEPTVIQQPGILVGINSILEEGRITLVTGETVFRHPDCVVILTTNVDYSGCRNLNQSLKDRCEFKIKLETPGKKVLVQRAINELGLKKDDVQDIDKMADVIMQLKNAAEANDFSDGEFGFRAFRNWVEHVILLNDITGSWDPVEAAEFGLFGSGSLNGDAEELFRSILDTHF